jgi:aquaporin Z
MGSRDFLAEFVGTALLLLIGLSAVVFDFAAGSPMVRWLPDEDVRRLLTGIVFAGTATAIVYSPLGRRSGGHINPAVTGAFLRLGKIAPRSAAGYWAAQFAGALAGALIVRAIWGRLAVQVHVGATVPGPRGVLVAVVAEAVGTFLLLTLILLFVDRPRLQRFTPAAAGLLVAFLVFVEAPVSGTSLNPARTLGPALVAGDYRGLWAYFVGPVAGALCATWVYLRGHRQVRCGKLIHDPRYECCFLDCAYTAEDQRLSRHHTTATT